MGDVDGRRANEMRELKQRVFRAMLNTRRSPDIQKETQMKDLQLKNLMKRAFKGMRESKRSRANSFSHAESVDDDSIASPDSPSDGPPGAELEFIADQLIEQLQTKAE